MILVVFAFVQRLLPCFIVFDLFGPISNDATKVDFLRWIVPQCAPMSRHLRRPTLRHFLTFGLLAPFFCCFGWFWWRFWIFNVFTFLPHFNPFCTVLPRFLKIVSPKYQDI